MGGRFTINYININMLKDLQKQENILIAQMEKEVKEG